MSQESVAQITRRCVVARQKQFKSHARGNGKFDPKPMSTLFESVMQHRNMEHLMGPHMAKPR